MSSLLTSATFDVPDEQESFDAFARERGWSDGLPLIAPTAERVQRYLAAWGVDGAHVVTSLPPSRVPVTAEKIAVNAVMAGAPAAALPLIAASLEAVGDPGFELHALQATTGSVTQAFLVNGPQRHALSIPFGTACLGGADGNAVSIGRAIRLIMRNVAGHKAGITSQSTFGQPARVAGLVFGEWEERSPWAPLAERRGVSGNAVTAFGTMGTVNVCELLGNDADLLTELIGKSMPYAGANSYLQALAFGEIVVAINPVWAELLSKRYPDVDDLRQQLWEHARLPLSQFPADRQEAFDRLGWIDDKGFVPLCREAQDVIVMVAGGLGGLHAALLHSWGTTRSQTVPVPPATS